MKRICLLAFVCSLFMMTAMAQTPADEIQVIVAPSHADWLYKTGETVRFRVSVLHNSIPMEDVTVRYTLREDQMEPFSTGEKVLKGGTCEIVAKGMRVPGFMRCEVSIDYEGRTNTGEATVGFEPEKLRPTVTMPNDFRDFWNRNLADVRQIPLNAEIEPWKEMSSQDVDVYMISYQNERWNARMYAAMLMPKDRLPGQKFPAIIEYPGAGVHSMDRYWGDCMKWAAEGNIVLIMRVHGIPPMETQIEYDILASGPLKEYWTINMQDKDLYYYKRIYTGCVKAVDFIYSLPEFNGSVVVEGGSQGGALSLVTAALDPRVKGCVVMYPALCDLEGTVRGRAGGWPQPFKFPQLCTEDRIAAFRYYDVANFARIITVPVTCSFGYNDTVCAPTSTYSTYNVITAPKELDIYEPTGHYSYPRQWTKHCKNIFKMLMH